MASYSPLQLLRELRHGARTYPARVRAVAECYLRAMGLIEMRSLPRVESCGAMVDGGFVAQLTELGQRRLQAIDRE